MLKLLKQESSCKFLPGILVMLVLGVLFFSLPQAVLADGGGPQPTPIPTSTLTLEVQYVEPQVQPTVEAPLPATENPVDVQVQVTLPPSGEEYPVEVTTGSGLPLGPLALLFLALVAFAVIAFLLFRKK